MLSNVGYQIVLSFLFQFLFLLIRQLCIGQSGSFCLDVYLHSKNNNNAELFSSFHFENVCTTETHLLCTLFLRNIAVQMLVLR